MYMTEDVKHEVGFCSLRLDMSIVGSLMRQTMHTGFSPGIDNVFWQNECVKVCK